MPYKPITNFGIKDSLGPDNPSKIIYGADLQVEFDAISDNLHLLAQIDLDGDGNINIPPELIEGLPDLIGAKADQVDLDAEVAARIAGDKVLQDKIDAIDPDGDLKVDWNEIDGKPGTFPPSAHNHDGDYLKTETDPTVPAHVKGITQTDIDGWNSGAGGTGYDDTQLKADLATETQARIDGDAALDLRIDTVEESIADGGGFVDAPDDGKLYGRQDAGWSEVVDAPTAWGDVTGKPSEFPPSSHAHAWGEITGKPSEFTPSSHGHSISEVTGLQAALSDVDADSVKSGTFTETVRESRYQGGSATLELNLANNFTMDFSRSTTYGLGLSGAPSGAGDAYGFTLTLDTTNMAGLAWDDKIKWSGGAAPTLTADSTYVFTFFSTDGGTTFKGFVGGEGFA